MCLNPIKRSFGMFLGFMLTKRDTKANPNKYQIIIDMRSLINVKEVQQLTDLLAAPSRSLSYVGDTTFLFFSSLNRNERLEWTKECDEVFSKIKVFHTSLHILSCPRKGSPPLLYLSITNQTMSFELGTHPRDR